MSGGGWKHGFIVLLAGYVLVYIHRIVTGVLKPEFSVIALKYGWDPTIFMSLSSSAYFYAYAAMQLPGGVFADALGMKKYAALSLALITGGTALMILEIPTAVIIGRLLIGGGAAAVFICIQRFIGIRLTHSLGGRATGTALMVGNIGALLATSPSRYAVNVMGFHLYLIMLGSLTAIVGILSYINLKDRGMEGIRVTESLKKIFIQLSQVVRNTHSLALAYTLATTYATVVAFQSFWGHEYYTQVFGADENASANYLLMVAMSFIVSTLIAGWITDKVIGRRKPVLILNSILHFVSWAVMLLPIYYPLRPSQVFGLGASILLGFAAGFHIVIPPMARELYKKEFSGTTFAFVNLAGFIAIAIYQSLGVAVAIGGIIALFTLLSLLSIAASILTKETLT
ncbi:MAG: hypothetical protein DRO10_01845 [Thermoprotei archaeon]|nr:MAG: hypothetical protein DRO10_01845 [Thermoprotei archaeon]